MRRRIPRFRSTPDGDGTVVVLPDLVTVFGFDAVVQPSGLDVTVDGKFVTHLAGFGRDDFEETFRLVIVVVVGTVIAAAVEVARRKPAQESVGAGVLAAVADRGGTRGASPEYG